MTVKYIYGPANAGTANDSVIESSISGRLEAGIGLGRLTTIPMPMKVIIPIPLTFILPMKGVMITVIP